MDRLIELKRKLTGVIEEADALIAVAEKEDRNLTEDEDGQFESFKKERDGLKARIERMETQRTERLSAANTDAGDDGLETRTGDVKIGENRAEGKPFDHLGDFAQAVYRSGIPGGKFDERLWGVRAAGSSSSTEAVNSEGGFLVTGEKGDGLMKRLYDNNQVISRCDKRTIQGAYYEFNALDETSRAAGSRSGGVRAYWGPELGGATQSQPKFDQRRIDLNKLTALWYASDEVLADAPLLAQEGEASFMEEYDFVVQDAILNGEGAGLPLGILSADATTSVAKENGQAADTITTMNIVKMWSRGWAPGRANAVWLINQDVEPQLFTMSLAVGTGGIPVYMPAGALSDSPFSTLMGRPVIPVEQCETVGTKSDIILADFSQYMVIDKGGINGASSIHLKFDYSQTCFRWVLRLGGMPKWKSKLTPASGSTNYLSPYVMLDSRD